MLRRVPDSAFEITIAVPVKDRREQMRRCLRSLLDQDHPSYEVLVLDNQSSDGTADACRVLAAEAPVPVRVEIVPGSVGAVRNHAGRLARSEFLAFTDSDCIAQPSWLSGLARALREDPGVAVVCGVTRPQEPVRARWPATLQVEEWSGLFESCNIAFRTAALRDSDGFDEQIGHYWEDTAAGYALLSQGWRVGFVPDAVVFHDVTYPGFAWHLRRALKMKNLGPVLRRYPQIAQDLFWGGIFVKRRDAELLAALGGAGAALVSGSVAPLLLTMPYMFDRLRPWRDPKGFWQTAIYDGAFVVGCARAGLSAGRVVL
jgi:glycosyltransferase involved in cell wall biosynthesis